MNKCLLSIYICSERCYKNNGINNPASVER